MLNFKFGGVTVLAVQLFNKIKRKKKKTKNMKKHVSLYFPDVTVQEEILAREIFGEIARLKHLANFTLTNDIWMYLIVGVSYRIYFVGVLNIGEKLNKSPIAKIKSSPIHLPVRYVEIHLFLLNLFLFVCV